MYGNKSTKKSKCLRCKNRGRDDRLIHGDVKQQQEELTSSFSELYERRVRERDATRSDERPANATRRKRKKKFLFSAAVKLLFIKKSGSSLLPNR